MEVLFYKELVQDAKKIRNEVFALEQGFKDEFDNLDSISVHVVVYDDTRAVATARFYTEDMETYFIGRIAVIKSYRKKKIGSYLLKEIEKEIVKQKGKEIKIHSQVQAKAFYLSLGYTDTMLEDLDEACPHVWLKKAL